MFFTEDFEPNISLLKHGTESGWGLNKSFFKSKAYKDLASHGADMTDMFNQDSHFEINGKHIPVDNFAHALEEVLQISERSFTKSRYKGLGEMNAEQLWDALNQNKNFLIFLVRAPLQKKISYSIVRYKGLGEMNAEQLWDTIMNPDMRILGQVTIEDALAADELFHALMGDEVEPRKDFIDENAKLVVNLDV